MKIKFFFLLSIIFLIFISCAAVNNVSKVIYDDFLNEIADNEIINKETAVLEPENAFLPSAGNFFENIKIGYFTNGSQMYARKYGYGAGSFKAVIFIARIHGGEDGAENSVRIMENYLTRNPQIIPKNMSVFFINPASAVRSRLIYSSRHPAGADPNRNFLDTDLTLNETAAIALFIENIAAHWKNVTVISAHQYDNLAGSRRTNGTGWVFPLYELTQKGLEAIEGKSGSTPVIMRKGIDNHYTNPPASDNLARMFSQLVNFQYEPMWFYNHSTNQAEMYPGEFIYFISRLNKKLNASIDIIEFEIPKSDRHITNSNTRIGLIRFLLFLLSLE